MILVRDIVLFILWLFIGFGGRMFEVWVYGFVEYWFGFF